MNVPHWTAHTDRHVEIDRHTRVMRSRSALYKRFNDTARLLRVFRIRESCDRTGIAPPRPPPSRSPVHAAIESLARPELGVLTVEEVSRQALLAINHLTPKPKGLRFDPRLLTNDRLESLMQSRHDLAIVDLLRSERTGRVNSQSSALRRSAMGSGAQPTDPRSDSLKAIQWRRHRLRRVSP